MALSGSSRTRCSAPGDTPFLRPLSYWGRFVWVALLTLGLTVAAHPDAGGSSSLPEVELPSQTASLVALGERLFRSPLLSADGTISCSTCHIPALGFSGDRPRAIGVAGYVGGRRAPALFGLRSATSFMWDGRATSLNAQVVMPLEGSEMAVNWATALPRLAVRRDIADLLAGTRPHTLDRSVVIAALAAYVASLDPDPSRFDRFYYGGNQTALTSQEGWGFRLFVRKAGCASCHLVDTGQLPSRMGAFMSLDLASRLRRKPTVAAPRSAGIPPTKVLSRPLPCAASRCGHISCTMAA
jgi:cytochrome c peroxidase